MKYLILEPSVFIEFSNDSVLLYNSVNGKKILYTDIEIITFFNKLKYDLNVIKIEVNFNKKISTDRVNFLKK